MKVEISKIPFVVKDIHKAIHNKETIRHNINNKSHVIHKTGKIGLRYLTININGEKIRFIEQNPNHTGILGKRAKNGEKITHGIRNGEWIYADDKNIIIPPLNNNQ